jgi:alpha-glucosidase
MRIAIPLAVLLAASLAADAETHVLESPDAALRLEFTIDDGVPGYALSRQDEAILETSRLGLQFRDGPPLDRGLAVVATARASHDERWPLPWGECAEVRDRHEELRVELADAAGRRMSIVFRLFDDGLGFRYELPRQELIDDFIIMDEVTEFRLAREATAWWIPAFEAERYEYLYRHTPVAEIGKVHTPLTLETAAGRYLCIHEAALTDYASMTLASAGGTALRCHLVPWASGVRVIGATPFVSPWRTIQVAETPGGLIESHLVLNLNEPCRIAETSWIRPGKYIGIWWGMHIGTQTWGSGPKHGATTKTARRYIDFAAQNGFSGVLIEGWNLGWDGNWWGNGGNFRFTTPHPDIDYPAVCRYAAERGVRVIGHHETGADIDNYERQMEAAFAYCRDLGIRAVKTGYVGRKCQGEWHHGQYMVRHYRKAVEMAAKYGVMLDVHEPIKDTGIRRTWPNMMTREGARGQEYNAWSGDGGNPPEHETILPFTRMLSGPFDFTPGIFRLLFPELRPNNRVNTTLVKQLALYVVLHSPLQMAADLPENYAGHPAFQFIRDVPCDWSETRALNGRIGDFVTIARKARSGEEWFLGSVTDEQGRTLEVPLDFLDPGVSYNATIYADGPDADWRANPYDYAITEIRVDRETRLTLRLAPGGGQAIRLRVAAAH